MRHARTATVTASAAITLLVFAAPTFAGAGDPTASVSSGYSDPDTGVEYSSAIHYTGDDGENSPVISATPDSYFTVHDETSALIAGGVCTGGGPPGADVSCQVEPQGLPPRVFLTVFTFGGDDSVDTRGVPRYGTAHFSSPERPTRIQLGTGDNRFLGGPGDERVDTGAGTDFLRGGRGADILSSFEGADRMYGGRGRDFVRAGRDDNVLSGGPGRDIIIGNRDDDTIHARDGFRDHVYCGSGRDVAIVDSRDLVSGCAKVLGR